MSRTLSNLINTAPLTTGSSLTTSVYTPTGFTAGDYVYYTQNVGYTAPPSFIPANGAYIPVGGKNFYAGLSQSTATLGLAGPNGVQFTYSGTTQTEMTSAVAATTITASAANGVISASLSNGNIVFVSQIGTSATATTLSFTIYNQLGTLVKSATTITTTANGSRPKGYAVAGHHNGTFLILWVDGSSNNLTTSCYYNDGTPLTTNNTPFANVGNNPNATNFNNLKMAVSSEGIVGTVWVNTSGNFFIQTMSANGVTMFSPSYSSSATAANSGLEVALVAPIPNQIYTNTGGFIAAWGSSTTTVAVRSFTTSLTTTRSIGVWNKAITGISGTALPDGSVCFVTNTAGSGNVDMTLFYAYPSTIDVNSPYLLQDITWQQTTATVISGSVVNSASATSSQYTPTISACLPSDPPSIYDYYGTPVTTPFYATRVALVCTYYTNTGTLAITKTIWSNQSAGINWSGVSTTVLATTPTNLTTAGYCASVSVANGVVFPTYCATTTTYATFSGWYTKTYTNGQSYFGMGINAPTYTFVGVALTTATAGSVGKVVINGLATLNSNYQSLPYSVAFDSRSSQTSAIGGNYGTVVGRTVTMKGSE